MPNGLPAFIPPSASPSPGPLQSAISQISALNTPQQPQDADHLRRLMMLLQGVDAINTSNFLRKPGAIETDPLMRPFAHAGNPLPMMGAYGLEDLLMSLFTRHSDKARKAAELSQILMNAGGIAQTALHRGGSNGTAPAAPKRSKPITTLPTGGSPSYVP